ncbi:MAG: thiamine pyrophosphokinase [Candidatus Poribacteria bacterium]|nr:thiamine pyrophosphokinase [Candidatus Poribacteria bacterium]
MKTARIFLNGYYDLRNIDFYRLEIDTGIDNGDLTLCADGGLRIFDELNKMEGNNFIPDILIGDLDSVNGTTTKTKQVVEQWVGQTDKDYTDGQLAVKYAIEKYNCQCILLYGGLPRPEEYETDHFLGNLKLLRFGHYLHRDTGIIYIAEMRDPQQTIHYLLSSLRIYRKDSGVQRVSLIAEEVNVMVENSQNLRWDLTSLNISPDLTNALRNEFVKGADWVEIQLMKDSPPVYVIHNWYT